MNKYEKFGYLLLDEAVICIDLVHLSIRFFNSSYKDDSFLDCFKEGIEDIQVEDIDETGSRKISIKLANVNRRHKIIIVINKFNYITEYYNDVVTEIGDHFMLFNRALRKIDLPCVEKIGDGFLPYCVGDIEVNAPNLRSLGSAFLTNNSCGARFNAPRLEECGLVNTNNTGIIEQIRRTIEINQRLNWMKLAQSVRDYHLIRNRERTFSQKNFCSVFEIVSQKNGKSYFILKYYNKDGSSTITYYIIDEKSNAIGRFHVGINIPEDMKGSHKLANASLLYYIDPDYQNMGIGKATIKYVLEDLFSNARYRIGKIIALTINERSLHLLSENNFESRKTGGSHSCICQLSRQQYFSLSEQELELFLLSFDEQNDYRGRDYIEFWKSASKLFPERFFMFDSYDSHSGYYIDMFKKHVGRCYDNNDDSFLDCFKEGIKSIQIIPMPENGKEIRILLQREKEHTIIIRTDYLNYITEYYNDVVTEIGDHFMLFNRALRKIDLPCVEKIGDGFLPYCVGDIEVNAPNLRSLGSAFLTNNSSGVKFNAPRLVKCGLVNTNNRELAESIERIIDGNRRLTGQQIGTAIFGVSVEECDRARKFLEGEKENVNFSNEKE